MSRGWSGAEILPGAGAKAFALSSLLKIDQNQSKTGASSNKNTGYAAETRVLTEDSLLIVKTEATRAKAPALLGTSSSKIRLLEHPYLLDFS